MPSKNDDDETDPRIGLWITGIILMIEIGILSDIYSGNVVMVRLIDIRILIRAQQIMMGVQRKFPFFGSPFIQLP